MVCAKAPENTCNLQIISLTLKKDLCKKATGKTSGSDQITYIDIYFYEYLYNLSDIPVNEPGSY